MPLVPFGEFLPDQPDYQNAGSSSIRNVVPRTKDSYGPMKSLMAISGALDGRSLGSTFVRDNAGNVAGFAGTSDRLYEFTSASVNWTDVTRLGAGKTITNITQANPGVVTSAGHGFSNGDTVYITGVVGMTQVNSRFFTVASSAVNTFALAAVDTTGYTAYSSAGTAKKETFYAVSTGEYWQFAQFDQRVVAVNINTAPQTFLIGTDTAFSALSSGAPNARYVAAVRDFCMVANTTDGSNGARPQRVWWSAIGDPTSWPTTGTTAAFSVQSDEQDLLGDGGWIQGLVAGLVNADMLVVQERRIWRGMYVGSPAVFSFQMVDAARGTPAPGSLVQAGGVAYMLADSGFIACDGAQVRTIGDQKVDHFFWADVDQNYLDRITSAVNPQDQLVMWAYPGAGNSGGLPNRLLIYHYNLDRFTIVDAITLEALSRGMTVGYTLDQLNPFGTLETLPYSLDSRAWTGGRLCLGAFDSSHKFGFFQGASLAASCDTSEAEINDNGIAYVNRVWGETDASAATVQVGYRNRLADQVTWTAPVTINTTTSSAGVRATGRFHRGRMAIPAAASWTYVQGVDFDARKAGRR